MTDTARTFTLDEARAIAELRDTLKAAVREIDRNTHKLDPLLARSQGIVFHAVANTCDMLHDLLSCAATYLDDPNAELALKVGYGDASWPASELALVPEPLAAIAVTPETQARFNALLDADGSVGSDAFVRWLCDLADAASSDLPAAGDRDELAELRDEVHTLARELEATNRVLASRTEHLA